MGIVIPKETFDMENELENSMNEPDKDTETFDDDDFDISDLENSLDELEDMLSTDDKKPIHKSKEKDMKIDKDVKKLKKQKSRYREEKEEMKLFLTRLIGILDGRTSYINNPKEILNGFMTGKKNREFTEFVNYSKIWEHEYVDINDAVFEKRFLTILYLFIMRFYDSMVANKCDKNSETQIDEIKNRRKVIKDFKHRIAVFHNTCVMRSDSFRYDFYDMMIYLNQGSFKKTEKMIQKIEDQLSCLNRSAGEDDSRTINDILKLSYVITTESMNFKHTFKPLQNVSFNDRNAIRQMIASLGKDIIKYQTKYSLPVLFGCWASANPYVKTNFDASSREMQMGLLAITYMDYVMNDPYISKTIRKLVCF